ncbi:type I restriction enzyme HsdR N-terminal domain-containing protein [Dysgonomonas massiliensis]|uniref:type I restriction enzyme HsdR N-terminal domain-containing protein n=1 Tax=Dysgonomonas massiliensis TaxID=2040292 RepID=UPI000C77C6A3|nr:type I restriction enzyme HsdR N-terminal domain-containing protein [Dysgonomonas massiliensis]
MFELNLPSFNPNIKKVNGRISIFDRLRRRFVALTPEEWVRQHFVNFLITERNYPESLIANEIQIDLNKQKKRCDSVVYGRDMKPLLILEYKAPEIKITQEVFNQIANYNIVLHVNYLIVSNGMEHYCCYVDYEKQSIKYLADIPSYESLLK